MLLSRTAQPAQKAVNPLHQHPQLQNSAASHGAKKALQQPEIINLVYPLWNSSSRHENQPKQKAVWSGFMHVKKTFQFHQSWLLGLAAPKPRLSTANCQPHQKTARSQGPSHHHHHHQKLPCANHGVTHHYRFFSVVQCLTRLHYNSVWHQSFAPLIIVFGCTLQSHR